MNQYSAELLGVVEEALVCHRPFGDSKYILDQFRTCSRRRLKAISDHMPSAGRLLEAFQQADSNSSTRVLENTVVRCAIQHAHTQVEAKTSYGLPLTDCAEIFDEAARYVQLGIPGIPLARSSVRLPRLGNEPYHGWIWSEDYPDDIFGRSFRFLVKQNFGEVLSAPSDDDIACLAKGERLLRSLMPLLAPSALSHTQFVGIFPHVGSWKSKASSSQIKVGGTIFLGQGLLRNPWTVAEHLLHESLHQKLYDFRHGHSLLEPDHAKIDAPRISSPWNPEDLNKANHWDAHRAFAAFHVYVQLFLLSVSAQQKAEELEDLYGPVNGMIESRKAFDRAWYLGEQLRIVCWNVLGSAGKALVDWLMSILLALEPSPPPRGADFHLVLDLYQREARKVDAELMNGSVPPAVLLRKLVSLTAEEVKNTRDILSSISADHELDEFNTALAQLSDKELEAEFSNVRRMIAHTLLKVSADGYGLSPTQRESEDPNGLVRRMVLDASQRLHAILLGIPDAVAAAKRRAYRQRFNNSCEDAVGRLLSVLAAAVPKAGRILEIGTGVGVGTAWIRYGLNERIDVEVSSVEVDRVLSDAALEWPWPAYMHIVTVDVSLLLGTNATYDLIVADPSPIKHGDLESTIRAIRPGGILIVHDLNTEIVNSETQIARSSELRQLLLHHPKLQSVELDWASGVIVATRTFEIF